MLIAGAGRCARVRSKSPLPLQTVSSGKQSWGRSLTNPASNILGNLLNAIEEAHIDHVIVQVSGDPQVVELQFRTRAASAGQQAKAHVSQV